MRTIRLTILLLTLSSAVLLTDATAQSGNKQKKDSTAKQKSAAEARRDGTAKSKTGATEQNRKRTHKKNINDRKTDKK